ncbi:MAG TPA: DNA repair and recombination protein RadB [Nanoarchaeota archaeon]|nr:DNA repair and recombination protein RadB [Nanoarchaeota archaeon]
MFIPISEPIDKLLGGGLEKGCITNFYGPPGSGKTQIAMVATASISSKGMRVVFIDTEGGFSFERLKQLVDDYESALKRIILFRVYSWKEQNECINKLINFENIKAVIVDSIVALWRLEISKENAFVINQQLAKQLSILARIASEKNIPVLITNQVYSDIEKGELELSSRNVVKSWSKNLVELIHAGKPNHRIAIVRKARAIPEGRRVEFEIYEKGLREVKFKLF